MYSKEKYAEMLEKMLLTRRFEEKVSYFFAMGMIHGTTHLYVGEEAVATGVCTALKQEDLIVSTHRGHGHCISKGIDLNKMMAELLGKSTGYCKGKGGSMHIADLNVGNLGANGVVGGGLPLAVGAGLTTQMKKIDRIVVCFFGDGASNQGTFHESLNLAAVWKLPILFVLENNKYGMSNSIKNSTAIDNLTVRADSYGMKGTEVDGMDVLKVHAATIEARNYVLQNGPMLLVCDTYRYLGHSKSDANVYRTTEEIESWKARDAIAQLENYLVENKIFTQDEIDAFEKDTRQQIEDATAYAQKSDYPSINDIETDVYA
ncbi:thiamine pyrophosphate-dependent dehydrogenase E1 component subunit alpha [Eubacteriales bacterium OttesenSCG-928-K08]|nr:thiamine pyrophosphate-dependent dehydrogenase E1 component subunit alpha [Eubacteriales bacterium OttesenSCG-928-K08]